MEVVSIYIALLNILICILTVIGNVLVLMAVIKTTQLHTPSNILLCNLVIADLGVGVITQPFFVSCQFFKNSPELRTGLNLSILVFAGVSTVEMTLISLDRYLALSLHLRYRAVVTVARTIKIVVILWIAAAIIIVIYFVRLEFIPLLGTLGAFLCFLTSTFIYIRIHLIVRRHKRQIRDQSLSVNAGPLPRHGKSIKTMYLVNGLFVLSWLPLVVLVVIRKWLISAVGKEGYQNIEQIAITFFLSNSLANPILYCWRMRQIREAVLKLLNKTLQRIRYNRNDRFPASIFPGLSKIKPQ